MTLINNQNITPQLNGLSIDDKRAELKSYFHNTWTTYESLFALINKDEAYYLRPETLRHPLIFYFGHTATFFINKLLLGKYINKRVNTKLEAVCAVGVDEMSWDDLNSEHYDWPNVDEVREYRQQVFTVVNNLIDTMEISLPIKQDSLAWVILMGCEHERIHLETSSVIMRMLPLDCLTQPSEVAGQWTSCANFSTAPTNELLPVTEQSIVLGKKLTDETYGWDNEYGELSVEVSAFSASKYLVSNQEFLAFIDAGGYKKPHYWSEEGQKWLSFTKAEMPRFWLKNNDEYVQRNLLNEMPLPLNWPAEVNYLEAKAFCHWKSEQTQKNIAMPTEAQWHCLINNASDNEQQVLGNINLARYASSCPIDEFSTGDFYDVIGNVWQWNESAIDGYEGFKVHPLYDDFSTPTFDGKHNLIKGGSWISTGNETIPSSRYAFRRHFTQHAGFRYVENIDGKIPLTPVNRYETDREVCQQLESHYGDQHLSVENYSQQVSQLLLNKVRALGINTDKLLNLGCSVGRTAFELSEHFQHIDAVDFSARYIQFGVQLQQQKTLRYTNVISGDIQSFHEVSLKALSLNNNADHIVFSQGDASNLKPIFNGYDAILVEHALEKSYQPKQLLATLSKRLNKQGLLFVLTDHQYSAKHTEKENWLGGLKVNGENVIGFDGLQEKLAEEFTFLDAQPLTRVIKQNQCTFTVTTTEMSVWQRKV
ncbi:5-histidylcysteine sulfoxide synthase [Colwellia sp. BRX8-9]|uniref:5-histidylcysteine sulfoxide synthase n=1 Tax=Colwellia sp. BRX8-9 TaxID=2759831 RepID=UPI0015F4583F|nr:5-histidylcysteine sulfoxide synthase [Colwellia sp. BRX8-9]MBA6347485.1 5-histidylcysteine sulfoxide synthase [Colwellia sp. BRX8-9]